MKSASKAFSNNSYLLNHIDQVVQESIAAKQEFYRSSSETMVKVAQWMAETIEKDNKILIFGNGGSAADAQHMAAEMVGRMLIERKKPLAAIALTTDSSNLTAIANDYSYDEVFSKQVEALARPGDLIFAISTSGNSKNVLAAVKAAKNANARVVGLTGGSGGELKKIADLCLCVEKGRNSSMIQETHISVVHLLVDLMDRFLLSETFVVREG